MRLQFHLISVLLIFTLLPFQRLYAGYGDFLVSDDVEVMKEDGHAKVFPGGHDEKYWATDAKGVQYKLRLKDVLPNYAEIGTSVLIDLIGAPNQAVHPILLKRGMQSLPTTAEAKLLAPGNEKMGLAGSRGEWFPATIQKVGKLQKFDLAHLTGKQLADLSAQLLVNYVVGNNDNKLGDGTDGNLGFDGTHFYTLAATQSFKKFPDEGSLSADLAFKQAHGLFVEVLKRLKADQVEDYVRTLNDYLTRLEKTNQTDLEPVLGHYFAGINSFRTFKQKSTFDYWQELFRRTVAARQGAIHFLENAGLDPVALEQLKTPSDATKVAVTLPSSSLRDETVPSTKTHSKQDLAWAFYFQDFWKKRHEAISLWSKELGLPEAEVISSLAYQTAAFKMGSLLQFPNYFALRKHTLQEIETALS